MITLTTEIKSRTFKEYEKQRLYNELRKPFENKKEEIKKTFKEWLDENVMMKVLNPDLMTLGKKPYCIRSTDRFLITPKELGLDETYTGKPGSKMKTNLKFEFRSDNYKYAVDGKTYLIDITLAILRNCSPEIIEQVKYFLYECAKADYEFDFYGIGTFVKPEEYGYSNYYGIFRDVKTWGNLWSRDPEMFKVLYKMEEGKEIEIVEPEKKLLSELKTSLGY
jgi:hypothetical protein